MSEWISVKDALPETYHEINDGLMSSKLVLVYGCAPHSKDRVIGVAWYLRDPNDKDWNEWDGVMMNVEEAMYCDITHWASIPELPKEDDDSPEINALDVIYEQNSVKHGRWIETENDSRISGHCSSCGWEAHLYEDDVIGMPYCPNCGAKMDGGEE